MVENGWYLLCPNCRRLLNTGWFELYSVITYKYYAMDLNGILWDENKKIYDEDLIKIGHSCGFYTDEYEIIEFRILIRNNKIED